MRKAAGNAGKQRAGNAGKQSAVLRMKKRNGIILRILDMEVCTDDYHNLHESQL